MRFFALLIFFSFYSMTGYSQVCPENTVCCETISGPSCGWADQTAAQGCKVPNGTTCKITATNQCARVTNNNPVPVFVSAQKSESMDWGSFLARVTTSNLPYTPCNNGCMLQAVPVAHGTSITAYSQPNVPYGQTCAAISQVRNCNDGNLSGTYGFANCTVDAPATCPPIDGITLNNGQSRTFYQAPCADTTPQCVGQTRTCTNGTVSGTYQYASCSAPAAVNCTVGSVTVNHGSSRVFYNTTSVPFGGDCNSATYSQNRTCTNGVMSGSASFDKDTCSVAAASSCPPVDGITLNHGQSATFYQAASGSPCVGETRTCTNGTLSGSYGFKGCWGGYSAWSACSKQCNTGTQSRTRTCSGTCTGSTTETQNCNTQSCCATFNTGTTPKWEFACSGNRCLINNNATSLNRRCTELGYEYNQSASVASPWCGTYGNARSTGWSGSAWTGQSSCVTSTASAVCCNYETPPPPPSGGVWVSQWMENCWDFYMSNCTPSNNCGTTNPAGASCSPVGANCMKATTTWFEGFQCQ